MPEGHEQEGYTLVQLAWRQFGAYDKFAELQKRRSTRVHLLLIILSALLVLFVLIKTQLSLCKLNYNQTSYYESLDDILEFLILIFPISLTAIVAANNRFKPLKKWVLLRSAAEALKSEIMRFRAAVPLQKDNESRDKIQNTLQQQMDGISENLMQSEINLTEITNRMHENNETLSEPIFLSSEQYINERLDEQLKFYSGHVKKLELKLKLFNYGIYALGGIGTYLAATNRQLWIALTTIVVSIISTYLEQQQTENTLMIYNQSGSRLLRIKNWWLLQPEKNRENPALVERLVDLTEDALKTETGKWVENMEVAHQKDQAVPIH